ncbi:hypothetical protein N0V94_009488, partial [Neodidymelliopsis sp. IMI 364377]
YFTTLLYTTTNHLSPTNFNPPNTTNMQFSILLAAMAATAVSAQYAVTNGTSTSAVAVPYPSASGTVSVQPSGTGAGSSKPTSSSTAPFEGAAAQLKGSAMGLIVAGGVALML